MDLTLYKKMIGGASSLPEGYISDTINHVNDMFDKSPSYRKIELSGDESDCIISRKKSNVIDVLFRPNAEIYDGSYIVLDDDTYIIVDHIDNEIYPKAMIQLCNELLKWVDENGVTHSYKCVVEGNSYKEEDPTGNEKFVFNLNGEIKVIVQYNEHTRKIAPNQKFIFGEGVYEVSSIDNISKVYNGNGIVEINVKHTNKSESDDLENKIADDSGNSGWGDW